jgi:hypothetical protein
VRQAARVRVPIVSPVSFLTMRRSPSMVAVRTAESQESTPMQAMSVLVVCENVTVSPETA